MISSYDADLFRSVKGAVSIQQVAGFCGLKTDKKGWCICPFHRDVHPSLKLYPDGKGFYCFVCGQGGDQVTLAARYLGVNNREAAVRLAAAFGVPIAEPVTYRERREAGIAEKRRQKITRWAKWASAQVKMYWILLCEARRDPVGPHFCEAICNLDRVEYLLDCLETDPEKVFNDRKAVKEIDRITGRLIGWHG